MKRAFEVTPLLVAAGAGALIFKFAKIGKVWWGALTGATIQLTVRILGVS